MPLGKEVGHGPGHIVLDGDPVGTHRHPHQPLSTFLAHVYCGPNGRPSQQLLSSCFTGRMPFLPPSQQCQSTVGKCG